MNEKVIQSVFISRQVRQRSKGSVLVLTMLIGVILLIVGLSMIQACYWSRLLALGQGSQVQSQTASDAGMAHALAWMQQELGQEAEWNPATFPYTFAQSLTDSNTGFSYTIDYNEPDLPDPNTGGFIVHVSGMSQGKDKQTHAWLYAGSAWTGIRVNRTAMLLTSQWNVTPAGSGIPVLSTNATESGSVLLSPGSVFPGDIVCGTGGIPSDVIQPVSVTQLDGCAYAARRQRVPVPVHIPSGFPATSGDLNSGVTLTGGDYTVDSVSMPAWNDLRITGPVRLYVIGDIALHPFSRLVVEQDASAGINGSLEIYLGGDLVVHWAAGVVNETNDARCLKLYGLPNEDQEMTLFLSGSGVQAAIYAPDALVQLQGFGGYTGAIVADRVAMLFASNFTYDTRLRTVSINDPAAVFEVGRWWEDPAS